jgi:hypothetical protein
VAEAVFVNFRLSYFPRQTGTMDDQQRQFLRNLVHQAIQAALNATIWRLPTPVLLVLLGSLIAAVIYFRLY